jgi:hypothetical protein
VGAEVKKRKPPLFSFYAGHNIYHDSGWLVWLMLFTRRDLMTSRDDGIVIFSGLHLEVSIFKPRLFDFSHPPRWHAIWYVWSDVEHITRRIAAKAGQPYWKTEHHLWTRIRDRIKPVVVSLDDNVTATIK